MADTILREREDEEILEKSPEEETYTDWVSATPVIRTPFPEYTTADDGSVVVKDTRPEPLQVETSDDGAVTIRVPV